MNVMQKNKYQNVDVITVDLIAMEHGVSRAEVNRLIARQIKKVRKDSIGEIKPFREGEHYFKFDKSQDASLSSSEYAVLFGSNAQKVAYLLTKKGYLMLVNAMDTAQAYRIQDRVIDVYFEAEDKYKQLEKQYNDLKANILRKDAALKFLPMKEAIENNESLSKVQKQWGVQNYSILICKAITGFTPKVYKKKYKTHGLEWRDHIKKTFPELLEAVSNTENFISQLQDTGMTYKEAKPAVEKYVAKQLEKVRDRVKKISM